MGTERNTAELYHQDCYFFDMSTASIRCEMSYFAGYEPRWFVILILIKFLIDPRWQTLRASSPIILLFSGE